MNILFDDDQPPDASLTAEEADRVYDRMQREWAPVREAMVYDHKTDRPRKVE